MHFSGRSQDRIRRRGENISAAELEFIAAEHEEVVECAAYGVPGELGEHEVKLDVYPRDAVVRRARVPPLARARSCRATWSRATSRSSRRELPKTPSQKIQKFKLAEAGVDRPEVDRVRAGPPLAAAVARSPRRRSAAPARAARPRPSPTPGAGRPTSESPDAPSLAAEEATTDWNGSVISTVAGVPCCSSMTASCRLHDEQAPQSPRPEMTMCARTAITLASSALITADARRLLAATRFRRAGRAAADLVGQDREQLPGQRLAVGDQADDRVLGQFAPRAPATPRPAVRPSRRGASTRIIGHRIQGTMQPSGPQSGNGSPAGRTRRVAR